MLKKILTTYYWYCLIYAGAAEPGGSGGVGPPLEFEIYLVNFLKNWEKKGFFRIGPPLGKNRSSAPANTFPRFFFQIV